MGLHADERITLTRPSLLLQWLTAYDFGEEEVIHEKVEAHFLRALEHTILRHWCWAEGETMVVDVE